MAEENKEAQAGAEKAPEAAKAEAAPAAAPAEGQPAEGAPKKSPLGKLFANKLILIVVAVVVLGGAGGGAFFFLKGGKAKKESKKVTVAKQEAHAAEKEEKKEEKKEEEKKEEPKGEAKAAEGGGEAEAEGGGEGQALIQHKFEPVIANVVEKNSLHYLKFQLVFDCSNAPVIEEIKVKTPQLRDALLFMINDMTLRELLSSGGKALLKEDIMSEFNKELTKGKIVKVYFSDFTVQ